jgi:hypothetical protein
MQQYFRNSASVQSMKGLLDSGQSLFCQRSSPAVVTASYLHACAAAVENNASDKSKNGPLKPGLSLFCQRSSPAVVTASYLHEWIQGQQHIIKKVAESKKAPMDSGQSLFCQRSSPAVVTASYLHKFKCSRFQQEFADSDKGRWTLGRACSASAARLLS